MDSQGSPTRVNPRSRSRKSIAHVPSSEIIGSKENGFPEALVLASPERAGIRKSRSKSLGPGGLDALRNDAGNRQKSAMGVQYKSILKPTGTLSLPTSNSEQSNARIMSPSRSKDKSSPGKSYTRRSVGSPKAVDILSILGDEESTEVLGKERSRTESESSGHGRTRVAVRTEEQQQAAEREREEILARKDARRKSLANRRVSFAPEATLHTWDVVEMPEDSTTSSASTNSTRRASGLTAPSASPYLQPRSPTTAYDVSEPPSTPPRQAEEMQVEASPAHQRDLHQKKQRRSSGIPPMNFNNPDDFSSSPYSPCSMIGEDAVQEVRADDIDADSSDSDDKDLVEEETVTGIDAQDVTRQSNDSSNTGPSGKLEEALRQAAQQAGTQGIDYDENGDITMEMADDEVTAAFKPWMKVVNGVPSVLGNPNTQQIQENVNPFSPAFHAETQSVNEGDKDESMDFTTAAGTILPPGHGKQTVLYISPDTHDPWRGAGSRHGSSWASSDSGEETMDSTVAVGGINSKSNVAHIEEEVGDSAPSEEDEGLSMEFTAVVGGVLGMKTGSAQINHFSDDGFTNQQRRNENAVEANTLLVKGNELKDLIPAADRDLTSTAKPEIGEDFTVGMDLTTGIGAILSRQSSVGERAWASLVSMAESEENKSIPTQSANQSMSVCLVPTVPEIDSSREELLQVSASNRRGESRRLIATPMLNPLTPTKKPATPSKQMTPRVVRPTTPGKTPPVKNVAMRTGSPKKLFKSEIKQATKMPDRPNTHSFSPLDHKLNQSAVPDDSTKPHSRRLSGLGFDRDGIGSPRVTEILRKRSSLNESSETFRSVGQPREGVRFADPQALERELDLERLEDEQHESDRGILQREANEKQWPVEETTTSNLKDRIQSLTPQKKKLKGRKSLHVGAAKGILGKRPAELDDDEDERDNTPKHLRAMEGSPIKKAKLPTPSTNTVSSRITRSVRAGLNETSANVRLSTPLTNASPLKGQVAETPKCQPHFRDTSFAASPVKANLSLVEGPVTQKPPVVNAPLTDDRIHLQDFLNLTCIRFMELTTTKRRHTLAPKPFSEHITTYNDLDKDHNAQEGGGCSLEDRVVAGACTLPMLDLYQHSCRELKNYINEGRSVVRDIEIETFEDNPTLFREYISAPVDLKAIMDNQFKNVKTHARLLSKAMWYEWRMKLLDGLKEGLVANREGMDNDAESLTQQEHLIGTALPHLVLEQDRIDSEVRALQAQAEELANCDPDQLKEARTNLVNVEADVGAKRTLIEELQGQLRQMGKSLGYAIERKDECSAEIQEAEKIRQESQGLDLSDIQALEDTVSSFERDHGWTVTSADQETLTMTYKRALQLYFTPRAFRSRGPHSNASGSHNAPISLTYIAGGHEYDPLSMSTEKRFFLQSTRAQLQFLQQSQVTVKHLCTFVSSSWDMACQVAEEAQILGARYITQTIILSDETLLVQSALLLRAIRTKVNIAIEVSIRNGEGVAEIDIRVKPSARVVYGEELNTKKMNDFLGQRLDLIKKGKNVEIGRWANVVGELERRLSARGKKS